MIMKKQVDEKKKKKVSKKLKKARSIVMMLLLCVMLLSAATYAWFSLSNTARVNNLTMTVSEADGLRVALDEGIGEPAEDKWSGSISLQEVKGVLVPATSADGKTFSKPKYDDEGKVSGVEALVGQDGELTKENTDDKKEGYYYTLTFYMQSLSEDADIKLVRGNGLGDASRKGTYVVRNSDKTVNSKTTQDNASAALRISMQSDGSDVMGIYEPCADVTFSGTKTGADRASYSPINGYTTQKQGKDGGFGEGYASEHSGVVLHLTKDKKTKITLHIWVEGEDSECVNQIELDNLLTQLQFVKDK